MCQDFNLIINEKWLRRSSSLVGVVSHEEGEREWDSS